jgi:hypothetical protein
MNSGDIGSTTARSIKFRVSCSRFEMSAGNSKFETQTTSNSNVQLEGDITSHTESF